MQIFAVEGLHLIETQRVTFRKNFRYGAGIAPGKGTRSCPQK
jgi:hypothetical protein